jgi:putative transposase
MGSEGNNIHQIIRNKREWHTPVDDESSKQGFRGWHSRGYLPHFDMPGAVQMLNYRLNDSLPMERHREWKSLFEIEHDLKRRQKIEEYLDRGYGNCELRDRRAAALVEENWRFLDGKEYRLLAWSIMPNHVHLLIEIWQTPLTLLVRNWKGYTARRINQLLGRRGKLWQDDYWDRYIRDQQHFERVKHYIEANPVMAGLVKSAPEWSFGSARFRDEYGRLKF